MQYVPNNLSESFEKIETKGGIYYKSKNISAKHFFTTRNTDLSTLPFDIITAEKQIHSADVKYITDSNKNEKHFCDGFVISKDSFTASGNSYGVAIRTADCVPILLFDRKNSVAAAVHAGWKGTIGQPLDAKRSDIPGIAAEAVRKMLIHGAEIQNINAAIGACIHKCCFEVKEDFISEVKNAVGSRANIFISEQKCLDGKTSYYFDLAGLNSALLQECGIDISDIAVSPLCTCCDTKMFYSYRHERQVVGTMYAAIEPF